MKFDSKILLVDDNQFILKSTRRLLEKSGYEIITAQNGEQTLDLIKTEHPDLVLLDINLPDISGYEICQRIKNDPFLRETLVILISAIDTDNENQSDGFEQGADGFISRPISNRNLLARIQAMLRIKRVTDQLKIKEEETRLLLEQSERSRRALLSILEDQKRSQETLQRHADELAGLYEVSKAINAIRDVREVYGQLSQKMAQLIGAEIGVVALLDPVTDEIQAQSPGYGIHSEDIAQIHFTRQAGLQMMNFDENPIFMVNLHEQIPTLFKQLTPSISIQSILIVALPVRGLFGGIIFVANKAEGFDEEDAHLLLTLANQAGVVIEKAELFHAEQRKRTEAQTLQEVTSVVTATLDQEQSFQMILDQLERVIPFDSASVQLLQADYLEIVGGRGWKDPTSVLGIRFPLNSDNPNTEVVRNRKALILGDAPSHFPAFRQPPHNHIRSWLGVPMIVHDEVIGILAIDSAMPNFYNQKNAQLVNAFANQAATSIENARLFQNALQSVERRAILHRASQQIVAASGDLESVYEAIYQATSQLMTVDAFALSLLDSARNEIELVCSYNYQQRMPKKRIPADCGLSHQVIASGQSLRIDDYFEDSDLSAVPFTDDLHVHSILAAPIRLGDKTLGMLSAQSDQPGDYDEEDQTLLEMLASFAVAAIENARLFEETQRRLREMEMVNRISVALRSAQSSDEMLPIFFEETLAVMDISAGSIVLYNPRLNIFHQSMSKGWFKNLSDSPPSLHKGIASHVLHTKQAYITEDFSNDPIAYTPNSTQIPPGWGGACLPIFSGQEISGIIYVSVELPRLISADEMNLLTTLTEMIGSAFHRASLHEETQQQLKRMTAMHNIDQAISSSLDLHLTLKILLDQILQQLGVDAASILLFDHYSHHLSVESSFGFQSNIHNRNFNNLRNSLAGQIVIENEPLIIHQIESYGQEFSDKEFFIEEGFCCYLGFPLIAKGHIRGVLEIFNRTHREQEHQWMSFLETLSGQAAIAIDNATLFGDLQSANTQLQLAYDNTLEGWASALELRDNETEGHSRRVTKMTLRLAEMMGLTDRQLVDIRRGALLHDIGKMGIPDSILAKKGPLSEDDWVIMRKHPIFAYDMLKSIRYLQRALDIPYCHHEKWDGTGYPRGLKGEQIPLAARIFAVIDVWDALNSDRPYRKAWQKEKVLSYIREQSGLHFDPQVVEVFLTIIENEPLLEKS